jgi:hypothetical protein
MNSIRIAPGAKDGGRVGLLRLQANRTHTDERDVVRLRIAELQRDAIKVVPRGGAFVCVCGQEGDPCDPAFEKVHRDILFEAGCALSSKPASLVTTKCLVKFST